MSDSIAALEIVAGGLGELLDQMVFVGGAVTKLYMDSPAVAEPRPTDDVDCVISLAGRIAYAELEKELRSLGFTHDTSTPTVVCRWNYCGIIVDIMPSDPAILGFSNRWYVDGIKNACEKLLPSGRIIKIFPLPYFVASKLEAFNSRGNTDIRLDSDLEDIVLVIDGSLEPLSKFMGIDPDLAKYLKSQFFTLLSRGDFNDALIGFLEHEGKDRVTRMKEVFKSVVSYCTL